jgi:Na+/H+ antiporter NhaD/arsenite permease-like protein
MDRFCRCRAPLAGNLLVVSSIANIIVLRAAEHRGMRLGWGSHARVGIPVTLAISVLFLWVRLRLL